MGEKELNVGGKTSLEVWGIQSRPIQMGIYHSNERCCISANLRHRRKLF